MGLFLRENGIYYLQVKNGYRYKRVSLETRDKNLAQEIYNAFLLEKVKNKLFPDRSSSEAQRIEDIPSVPPPSIGAQFQEYIELCEAQGISLGVIYDKKRLLKLFRSYKIQALEDISQDFINKIVRKHLPSMANKLVKNLKSFLNFCIKRQYYERSRYESLTFLMSKDKVRETIISQKDYEKLLSHCKDKDMRLYLQTLWQLMVQPGCTVERCTAGKRGAGPMKLSGCRKGILTLKRGLPKFTKAKPKGAKLSTLPTGF